MVREWKGGIGTKQRWGEADRQIIISFEEEKYQGSFRTEIEKSGKINKEG